LKHQIGPWLFATALDVGYVALNTTRYIGFAGVQAVTSAPSVYDFSVGAFRKCRDVRFESEMRIKADVRRPI
jgi:hypothetical protein